MTQLDKLVSEQDADTIIYIGSANAWFFVGTKAEYGGEIDHISEDLLNNRLRRARENMRLFHRRVREAKKLAERGETPRPTSLANINAAISSGLSNTAYAARFVPVRARQIRDSYHGINGKDFKILVEGDEEGKYWDYEEYRADHKSSAKEEGL